MSPPRRALRRIAPGLVLMVLLVAAFLNLISAEGVQQDGKTPGDGSAPPYAAPPPAAPPPAAAGAFAPSTAASAAAASAAAAASNSSTAEPPPPPAPGEEWTRALVNAENPLAEGSTPPLAPLPNGLLFDGRAIGQLEALLAAGEAQGLSLVVCSAYRTRGEQHGLFNAQVRELEAQGLPPEQAEAQAATQVAAPGTSEHELGLAADIVAAAHQSLDDA